MSWRGKILGGGIGFVLGGPLGAIIGAVLGHHVLDENSGTSFGFSNLEASQSIYFIATFSMLGKLAKSDGVVTEAEISVIEAVMRNNLRLNAETRQLAIGIFNEAKDSSSSFDQFAQQFYDHFRSSEEVLVSMIELLLLVGYADGQMDSAEERLILVAVNKFGLKDRYRQIKSRFTGTPDDIGKYYQILGCSRGDSKNEVKKKYRKLAMEYHPDRIHAKGVPREFAQVSQDRFKEIQNAYDVVSKDLEDSE
jgi:DnaJ like chaperone protein|tara:strand:- start:6465 stop:7217 length:753 start_codon:yes stop_codon:yes gene_type:complete